MPVKTSAIIGKLVELEAKLDEHLFARPSENEEEHATAGRNARRVAGGAVIVGTGAMGHKLIQTHYGHMGTESYRQAARDIGNTARHAPSDAAAAGRRAAEGASQAVRQRTAGALERLGKAGVKTAKRLRR